MLARAERWEGIMEWVVDECACKKKYTIRAASSQKAKVKIASGFASPA